MPWALTNYLELRQAGVYGSVTVAFTVPANSGEPTNVEAMSADPMLKSAAVENGRTSRVGISAILMQWDANTRPRFITLSVNQNHVTSRFPRSMSWRSCLRSHRLSTLNSDAGSFRVT